MSAPKPKPTDAVEGLNRMAAARGWDVTTGVQGDGHEWSTYALGAWRIRVNWTYSLHIYDASVTHVDDPLFMRSAPTLDMPCNSQQRRFVWVSDLLYRLTPDATKEAV